MESMLLVTLGWLFCRNEACRYVGIVTAPLDGRECLEEQAEQTVRITMIRILFFAIVGGALAAYFAYPYGIIPALLAYAFGGAFFILLDSLRVLLPQARRDRAEVEHPATPAEYTLAGALTDDKAPAPIPFAPKMDKGPSEPKA
jgi:hypothetical protein